MTLQAAGPYAGWGMSGVAIRFDRELPGQFFLERIGDSSKRQEFRTGTIRGRW